MLTCGVCGRQWAWHRPECSPLMARIFPGICPPCHTKAKRRVTRVDPEWLVRWRAITPPLYRDSDPDKLPLVSGCRAVLDWQYSPRGILAYGPPMAGKTRSMFLLLKRLCKEGHTPATFSGIGFGHACAEAFGEGTGRAWMGRLTAIDVLLIDDMGKEKLTERVESELFGLLRHRMDNQLPTLITTNLTGDLLKDLMSRDRAEALLSRLRDPDFFQVVPFAG